MSVFQTLRTSPWLAKVALLWFALTLGVAVASTMVNPQQELMICSAAGMLKVTLNADGSLSSTPAADTYCTLCVVGGAPPVFHRLALNLAQHLGHALQPVVAAHIAARTAAPPPSRAPPTL